MPPTSARKPAAGRQAPLAPLQRRSLGEEAADELRQLILLEKLAPGAAIAERDLAEGLGISRTPLRDALRMLEAEGLVEYSASRRPHVANPSLAELTENLQVLAVLEALAGELAAHNISKSALATIARLNETMHNSSDTSPPLAFFQKDMAFHAAIVEASGNAALVATHSQYNARLWRARYLSSQRRVDRANTLAQHQAITSALQARDPDAAAAALRRHLLTAIDNIGKQFAEASNSG